MPWTVDDVDQFKAGLTDAQKRQWVAIANRALAACIRANGTDCDAKAIRQANGAVKQASEAPPAASSMFATRDTANADRLHVFQPATFAEPPEWSPFLPTPGVYDHPQYGELDFRPEAYERIIENFKTGIYQEKLPVTVEHERYSSAVGWIRDMRLVDSGAIEAQVEWNARGRALLNDNRYLYVSAEWMPEWSPPDDPETTYRDVAVGLTLCTHPYFKERVLPPLAASEAVLTRHAGEPGEEPSVSDDPKQTDAQDEPTKDVTPEPDAPPPEEEAPMPDEKKPEEMPKPDAQSTEQETVTQITDRIMAELTEKLGEKPKISDPIVQEFVDRAAKEVAALRIKASDSEKIATQLTEQNAQLRQQHRAKLFTDEVMGRSDSNGSAWVGDVKDHVRMALALAEQFGPDSWELAQYIQTNRAHAEQIKAGYLFKEIGTSKGGDGLSAKDKLEFAARRFKEQDPKLTHEAAYTLALKDHPELYDQMTHEE